MKFEHPSSNYDELYNELFGNRHSSLAFNHHTKLPKNYPNINHHIQFVTTAWPIASRMLPHPSAPTRTRFPINSHLLKQTLNSTRRTNKSALIVQHQRDGTRRWSAFAEGCGSLITVNRKLQMHNQFVCIDEKPINFTHFSNIELDFSARTTTSTTVIRINIDFSPHTKDPIHQYVCTHTNTTDKMDQKNLKPHQRNARKCHAHRNVDTTQIGFR